MTTATLADILVKCGVIHHTAPNSTIELGHISEAAALVTAEESNAEVINAEMVRADLELIDILAAKLDRPVATMAEGIFALANERERIQGDGIHTCSSHCKRLTCVLRRERDAWRECARKLAATLRSELRGEDARYTGTGNRCAQDDLAEYDRLTIQAIAAPTAALGEPPPQKRAMAAETSCHAPEDGAR